MGISLQSRESCSFATCYSNYPTDQMRLCSAHGFWPFWRPQ